MSKKTARVPNNSGRNSTGSSGKSYESVRKPFSADDCDGRPTSFVFTDDLTDEDLMPSRMSYDETPDVVTGPGYSEFSNYSTVDSYSSSYQQSPDLEPPMLTMEARENQMILLATRLAEKQLAEGTASAQVITHYLKLGSTKERLEKEKLERENELLRAKAEQIQQAAYTEELYVNAIEAMKRYSGSE